MNHITLLSAGDSWESAKQNLLKRMKRREKNITEHPDQAIVLKKVKITPGKKLEELVAALSEPLLMRKVTSVVKQVYERFLTRNLYTPVTTNMLGKFVSDLERDFDAVVGQ